MKVWLSISKEQGYYKSVSLSHLEEPRVGQIRRATGGLLASVPDCLGVSVGRGVDAGLATGLLVQPLCSVPPRARNTATTRSRGFDFTLSRTVDRCFIRSESSRRDSRPLRASTSVSTYPFLSLVEHFGLSQRHTAFLLIRNNRVSFKCPLNVQVRIIPRDGALQLGTIKLCGLR